MNQKEKDLLEKVLQAAEIHYDLDENLQKAKNAMFCQFVGSVRVFFTLLSSGDYDIGAIESRIISYSVMHKLSERALGPEEVLKVEIKSVKEMLLKEDVESAV